MCICWYMRVRSFVLSEWNVRIANHNAFQSVAFYRNSWTHNIPFQHTLYLSTISSQRRNTTNDNPPFCISLDLPLLSHLCFLLFQISLKKTTKKKRKKCMGKPKTKIFFFSFEMRWDAGVLLLLLSQILAFSWFSPPTVMFYFMLPLIIVIFKNFITP